MEGRREGKERRERDREKEGGKGTYFKIRRRKKDRRDEKEKEARDKRVGRETEEGGGECLMPRIITTFNLERPRVPLFLSTI